MVSEAPGFNEEKGFCWPVGKTETISRIIDDCSFRDFSTKNVRARVNSVRPICVAEEYESAPAYDPKHGRDLLTTCRKNHPTFQKSWPLVEVRNKARLLFPNKLDDTVIIFY